MTDQPVTCNPREGTVNRKDPRFGLAAGDMVDADRVYFFFAASRSGHHAIMKFIQQQFSGIVRHLNFCDWGATSFFGAWNTDTPFTLGERIQLLTTNYENFDLTRFDPKRHQERISLFVNGTPIIKKFLVLRDPYNHLLSKIRAGYTWARWDKDKYLQYAKHFLEIERPFKHSIDINYNRWCADPEYRMWLAQAVGGDRTVDYVDRVSPYGVASSFDGMGYDGRAQEMNVLERWKLYSIKEILDNQEFLFDDEVVELSKILFGEDFIAEIVEELKHRVSHESNNVQRPNAETA